jgi:hypothetical protein
MNTYNNSKLIDNIFLVVIAIIFLFFLLYKPEYDCVISTNYVNNNSEHYANNTRYNITGITQKDINNSFGTEYGNIVPIVDRTVNKIINYTIRIVITPCMISKKLNNLDSRIKCITEYKHYYTDILNIPISDMFSEMNRDRLHIDPFKGQTKKSDQQYEATVGLAQAFTKSLEDTIAIMKTKYSTFGYDPIDFENNLKFVLKQEFIYSLMEIFRDPDKKWSISNTYITQNIN